MTLVGVRHLIVGVNKMDEAKYSKERFDEIVREVVPILRKAGWNTDKVPILPISAVVGDNIIEPSTNMLWWDGG